MAEETEETPTARQLAAARDFVARHGKPSRAVVENIGRVGARVVLVGADGALGDVLVAGPGRAPRSSRRWTTSKPRNGTARL